MNRRLQAALDRPTPISSQITQFQARLGSRQPMPDEAAQLKQLNTALDAEIRSFRTLLPELAAQINVASEADSRLTRTEDLTEMQQTLRALRQRTGTNAAVVYTLMGPERCSTLLVTADDTGRDEADA